MDRSRRLLLFYARVALGTAFLSAVADRFGLWGPPDATNVAWGDMTRFLAYANRLNWFATRRSSSRWDGRRPSWRSCWVCC